MRILNIIQIVRDNNNKILKYTVQDNSGVIENIESKELKNQIRQKLVTISSFKLTSNNRLIRTDKHVNYAVNLADNLRLNTKNDSYLLMNKDSLVAHIDIFFDTHLISGKLPYDYDNARDWIALRAKFSCARNVREFFKEIGINSVSDFIGITHCVSLHDTFWIKEYNSKLEWNQVSPFRNDYSKVISTYALEGKIIGKDKNYFSPVISTDGTFPHTWKFNNGNIVFIKASSKYTLGGSNSGREPYSEYYASLIAEYLGFRHITYTIRKHIRQDNRIDIITECKCYTTEEIGAISAHKLGLTSYEMVIDYCKKLGNEAYNNILNMLFLDCLLLNTDRHFSNIEFFMNNRTLEILGLVPIFDNNYSMLPRFMEGYDTFDRSEFLARDDRTFDDLYKMITTHKSFKRELIKMKRLVLPEPKAVSIKPERLKFLNEFIQMQVGYLLNKQ